MLKFVSDVDLHTMKIVLHDVEASFKKFDFLFISPHAWLWIAIDRFESR